MLYVTIKTITMSIPIPVYRQILFGQSFPFVLLLGIDTSIISLQPDQITQLQTLLASLQAIWHKHQSTFFKW